MLSKTIIAGAGLLLAVPAAPAFASDSSDGAETKGSCSAGAYWELKAESHDGGTEVEFEVKSGVAGQSWDYLLSGPDGVLAEGTRSTNSRGKFEVKVLTDGSVSDTYTATATSDSQVCDSTVGLFADDDADDDGDHSDDADDDSDDDSGTDDDMYEGSCSAGSAVAMTVKKAGKNRVAKLSLDGTRKGEKWRYTIKRGNKVVERGVTRTKGKKASFKITKKTRGKGRLSATAERVGGGEDCSVDDDDTNDD